MRHIICVTRVPQNIPVAEGIEIIKRCYYGISVKYLLYFGHDIANVVWVAFKNMKGVYYGLRWIYINDILVFM